MPSEKTHIAVANRFQATMNHLLQDDETCIEWIAVVAFYKAVYIVEAVFSSEGLPSSNCHDDRERKLKTIRRFGNIWTHYRPLLAASQIARFLSSRGVNYQCFHDFMTVGDVRDDLLAHRLNQLEKSASKFLKDKNNLVRVK